MLAHLEILLGKREREITDFSAIVFLLLCGFCSDEISFLLGVRCLESAASFDFGFLRVLLKLFLKISVF